MVATERVRARLTGIRDELKDALRAYTALPACVDLVFIGNTSDLYPSSLGLMVDFDAFVFVQHMDRSAGEPLAELRERFRERCTADGVDFELRIIEGPYKPAVRRLPRPAFVAHIGVFTEALYRASAPLKRWAWRKYVCEREAGRLARLAPPQPALSELVSGPKGLRERRAALESGVVEMTEWLLPDLTSIAIVVDRSQPNFVECCFAYAASAARHHARAQGLVEADRLGNAEFFPWYDSEVFRSPELVELMNHKAACRDTGFVLPVEPARELALGYLRALERHL